MLNTRHIEMLVRLERKRFEKALNKNARLIAILFCRPELDLMQKDIIPSLPYFHMRAGGNTAFYFAGFRGHLEDWPKLPEIAKLVIGKNGTGSKLTAEMRGQLARNKGYISITGPKNTRWYFVPSSFDLFRRQVEYRTRWRYSGGCDMILLNSRRGQKGGPKSLPVLDFTTAMVLRLDKIHELVATPTVSQLFETIFQYAEQQNDVDPTWGLSDHLGLKTARLGLWDVILGVLPQAVRASIKAARHLVAQDIGMPAAQLR